MAVLVGSPSTAAAATAHCRIFARLHCCWPGGGGRKDDVVLNFVRPTRFCVLVLRCVCPHTTGGGDGAPNPRGAAIR